ncbi:MAG: hypothetical protein AABW82_00905 [Nanoarchaeota archaeon]
MVNKKGQEEIVGFALVIIIVAVVGLLLLGLAIRSGDKGAKSDNYEIRQFLDSSMHVSSDCSLRSNIDYASVSDLVRECYRNQARECLSSGEKVCLALNRSLQGIINSGLKIGPERPNKGFMMNISFEQKTGESSSFLELKDGKCDKDYTAGEYLIPEDRSKGLIVVRLTLCK